MIASNDDKLLPVRERFTLVRAPRDERLDDFATDVRAGLTATPKRLSAKWLYDDLGSVLFEAICALPEYYLTRTEAEILDRYADEMVAAVGSPFELVEFGSGNARKTRTLIGAALRAQDRLTYRPIDISTSALEASAESLVAEYERLDVVAYADDYTALLASERLRTDRRVLALFLGSNIGNYEPHAARALLGAMSASFKPGDRLLLGADRKKDAVTLERAYDDPTGVTAAFDKNVLARINRELGGAFDLDAFSFSARYDGARGAVDSLLVARRGMTVPIAALGIDVTMRAYETIHTESSYKFGPSDVERLAEDSGFRVARAWSDPAERYAVSLLVVR